MDYRRSSRWGGAAMDVLSLRPGLRIDDRFELIEQLGAGGMGAVWKVRHCRLNSVYALKVLLHANPILTQRFLQEGRLQARIRHPNVVRIFDVITVDHRPALVMELIDGPDLSRLLKQRSLTQPQVDALAAGLFSGLTAIHQANLIHRDLKPANILLQPSKKGLIPKLTYFGSARAADQAHGSTQNGGRMGTLGLLSPATIAHPGAVE